MSFFDIFKKTETPVTEESEEKKKHVPVQAPARTAESLQAEQLRYLRGTALLNGERLKTLKPGRIAEDLKRIDKARGLADKELALAASEKDRRELEKWKAGLGLLGAMYRAQIRENQGRGSAKTSQTAKK